LCLCLCWRCLVLLGVGVGADVGILYIDIVYCIFYIDIGMLHVACCMLHVAFLCCMLHVVTRNL
jgi:hypothetical protein